MKQFPSVHRGVAVISALFLLVVLAALGAFMVTFSNTQHLTSAQDVRGTQAYWAARAGLDWAIPQVIATNSCPAATSTFVVETFEVQVACASPTYNEGMTVTVINISALACLPRPCGNGSVYMTYVERSVSASVER